MKIVEGNFKKIGLGKRPDTIARVGSGGGKKGALFGERDL